MSLIVERLASAFTTVPTFSQWTWVGLTVALYGSAALWILHKAKLFKRSSEKVPVSKLLLLALIAIFTPSLIEETLYRVLLLPHPNEAATLSTTIGLTLFSVALYVVAHPLLAWLVWPWSRQIFYRGSFLAIVTLLGVACSFVYLLTGSVYAPLFIHWLTIVVWKAFYGGPDFNLGKQQQAA